MLELFQCTKDGSDIHRSSNRKCISVMCKVGNQQISEPSFGIHKNSPVVQLSLI